MLLISHLILLSTLWTREQDAMQVLCHFCNEWGHSVPIRSAICPACLPKDQPLGHWKLSTGSEKGKAGHIQGPCTNSSHSKSLMLLFQFPITAGNNWKHHPWHRSLSANYCFLKMRRRWPKQQGKINITRTNPEFLHFIMASPHSSGSFLFETLLLPLWCIVSNT